MNLSGATLIKRLDQHLISTQLDGELVMMNLQNGDYLGLETSALDIWDLLSDVISFGELIQKMLELYDISEEECRRQVSLFLEQLHDNGMLELHSA